MTILHGDVSRFETIEQFLNGFNITWRDVLTASDENLQQSILESYNDELGDTEDDWPHANAPGDVPEEYLEEFWKTTSLPEREIVEMVLEQQTTPYVHLYDGYTHTVVEVFPDSHEQLVIH